MIPSALLCLIWQRSQEPIVTDRPDFTESAVVVPRRRTQVETGLTAMWPDRSKSVRLPEVLLRSWIAEKAEVRIGLPNWNAVDGERPGFDDLYLGAKIELGPVAGWDVAIIPALYLPVGSDAYRSERTSPEVKLAYATDLDERTSISAMTSGLWLTESDARVVDLGQTVSLGLALDARTGAFLEYAGTFRSRARGSHVVHAGFTFRPTPERQWDIHFGASLSGGSRNPFVGFGYSQRF